MPYCPSRPTLHPSPSRYLLVTFRTTSRSSCTYLILASPAHKIGARQQVATDQTGLPLAPSLQALFWVRAASYYQGPGVARRSPPERWPPWVLILTLFPCPVRGKADHSAHCCWPGTSAYSLWFLTTASTSADSMVIPPCSPPCLSGHAFSFLAPD